MQSVNVIIESNSHQIEWRLQYLAFEQQSVFLSEFLESSKYDIICNSVLDMAYM